MVIGNWRLGLALAGLLGLTLGGCTMGRGAFAGLNPFTWLKPSTYKEIHRQHEFQRTNTTSHNE